MVRSVWSGSISLNGVRIPIKLHTAVREHKTKFSMITPTHRGKVRQPDGSVEEVEHIGAIGYQYTCKLCGAKFERSQTLKGYWIDDRRVVSIDPKELEQLLPVSTRTIEVVGFVDFNEVDRLYLHTPFYITPNTDVKNGGVAGVDKAFWILVEGLKATNKVALGKMVKNNREHIVLIAPHNGGLILNLLRWHDEVVEMPEVPKVQISERGLELMKKLIEKFSTPLDLTKFEDTFEQKINQLIEARATGKDFRVEVEEAPSSDILQALEQAVAVA